MVSSVCMVVQSYCPDDPRVAREAEALAARGARVDVVCLRKRGQAASETVAGVRYLRLPIRRQRGGKLRYFFEYTSFFALSFLVSAFLVLRRRYDVFQAHNLPDILVFCGVPQRLRGTKIVFDMHDLMPELYVTKFHLREDSLPVRILELQERAAYGYSDLVITTSLAFRRKLVERGRNPDKLRLVMNSPDERVFPEPSAPSPRDNGVFRIIFNGVIADRSGPDVAVRAFALVHDKIPNSRLDFYGSGDTEVECERLTRELRLEEAVSFHGHISLTEMPQHIDSADLGVVPNRINAFTALNFPTRIFEYLRMRKVAVVSRTPGVVEYFGEDGLLYFEPGDEGDLARAILEAYENPQHAREVMERGLRVYDDYRWEKESAHYLQLLDGLVAAEGSPGRRDRLPGDRQPRV